MSPKIGILVVGLGGNNGVTLLAGHVANDLSLSWETQNGPMSANWYGCITQIDSKGDHGGCGFRDRLSGGSYGGLASATEAVIGGWDVRPTPLGDALYESRVLEYDLVRKVRDGMNSIKVMKGVYDPSFVGESQHATATHVVRGDDDLTLRSRVERLRKDIRRFRSENGLLGEDGGHVTVIWSASVERPSSASYSTADELLGAIYGADENDDDVSPSVLYAVASALEGCSFVNGGSQNTLSPALSELYGVEYRSSISGGILGKLGIGGLYCPDRPAYLLGTDFKAGQTKFKTAAVEYIRALGLLPMVVASSNHLGNNDMLNLTTKKTLDAKMRVKSNIFGPWDEPQLDHQVRVMYTPYIGDEKRDVVEYTSLGFLGCQHTMLTYTRCMDSVLCVPLMVDVAVWCDLFSRVDVSTKDAARATAYLFKVPEGGAAGVDPGFHRQMGELEDVLNTRCGGTTSSTAREEGRHLTWDVVEKAVGDGVLTREQADALRGLAKE